MFVACMNVNDMDVLLVHHTDPFHTNYIKPFSKYGAHVMFVVLLLPAFLRHVPTYCATSDSLFLLRPCETTKRSPPSPTGIVARSSHTDTTPTGPRSRCRSGWCRGLGRGWSLRHHRGGARPRRPRVARADWPHVGQCDLVARTRRP